MIQYNPEIKIFISNFCKDIIIEHCLRKYNKAYLPSETAEQQAYGLLAGEVKGNDIFIKGVYTSKLNHRNDPSVVNYINDLINKYAIPSGTPISQRGWVAKPEEVMEAHDYFDSMGLDLVGAYHMHHRKSWNGNQPKEYPSKFDEKLAENSNSLMFIVSIVSSKQYSVRAFYNGLKEKEIEVLYFAVR